MVAVGRPTTGFNIKLYICPTHSALDVPVSTALVSFNTAHRLICIVGIMT